MHLLKHKEKKSQPLVPIRSHFKVPFHRRMRGKRYNSNGEFVCETGPKHQVDTAEQKRLKEAMAAANNLPKPVDGGEFDMARLRPLPGRILARRGPIITEEKGIALPEDKHRHEPYYVVLSVGVGVTVCSPGDKIIFSKTHSPKPVKLGRGGFYIGKMRYVAAIVE